MLRNEVGVKQTDRISCPSLCKGHPPFSNERMESPVLEKKSLGDGRAPSGGPFCRARKIFRATASTLAVEIPFPFSSTIVLSKNRIRFSWASGGCLERRIPGKNGNGRYPEKHWKCEWLSQQKMRTKEQNINLENRATAPTAKPLHYPQRFCGKNNHYVATKRTR